MKAHLKTRQLLISTIVVTIILQLGGIPMGYSQEIKSSEVTPPPISSLEMNRLLITVERQKAIQELSDISRQLKMQRASNFTALAIAVVSSAVLLAVPLNKIKKGEFITGRTEQGLTYVENKIKIMFGPNTPIIKPAYLMTASAVALPVAVRYYVIHALDTQSLAKALDQAQRNLLEIERVMQTLDEDGELPK